MYKATVGQLPLFMEHPSAEFHDQLLRALQPLYAHPGEVLIQQGGTDTACYLMIKGSLEVWYTPKGARGGGEAPVDAARDVDRRSLFFQRGEGEAGVAAQRLLLPCCGAAAIASNITHSIDCRLSQIE